MQTSRRSFLGMLGGAIAGGRKGVESVSSEIGRRVMPYGASTVADGVSMGSSHHGFSPHEEGKSLGVEAMRLLGIPDFIRDQWRREHSRVDVLDPDLAAMQSMSLSARILIQRERNMATVENEFWSQGVEETKRRAWRKAFGWPSWGWW